MKKQSIKKWILGLCSAMILSLVVGFSLPKTEAKALSVDEYNIYDYSWANYFNIDNISYLPESYAIKVRPTDIEDGTKGFTVSANGSTSPSTVNLASCFGDGGVLSDIVEEGYYTVSFDIIDHNIDLGENDYIALGFFLQGQSEYWNLVYISGDYINITAAAFEYKTTLKLCLFVYGSGAIRALPSSFYVTFGHVGVYAGKNNTPDYTPYFYSLETLPDIDDGNGDSGNSGSGSGGSITPDVPDVPNGSYQEGFLAGLAQAQYGIFSIASFKLHIANSMEHNVSEIFDVEPDYIYGGLDFSSVYRNYHQNYPDINYCFLTISFSSPISLSSLDLLSYGESSLFYYRQSDTGVLVSRPWYLTLDTVPLSDSLLWRNSNVWGDLSNALSYQSIPISSTGYFDKIQTFTFSSLSSLNGFKLLVSNNEYSAGFDVGSSSVNTDSYDKGYEYGYNVGNNVGYNTGYYDGHKAGLSEDPYGFVDFAFSLLDMPGRIIYNWLNFDFLGVNLAGLVASIITLIVVSFVLKTRL